MQYYYKIFFFLAKCIVFAYLIGVGLIFVVILIDLAFGPYWGYPWQAALLAPLMFAGGLIMRVFISVFESPGRNQADRSHDHEHHP